MPVEAFLGLCDKVRVLRENGLERFFVAQSHALTATMARSAEGKLETAADYAWACTVVV